MGDRAAFERQDERLGDQGDPLEPLGEEDADPQVPAHQGPNECDSGVLRDGAIRVRHHGVLL